MGFLFVDRIDALDEHRARGHLDLRPGHAALPPWLVLEAVGQLAAWVAMARTNFASRPVAALVGEARLGATAWRETGGGSVELTVHLERLDGRAVLYSGAAVCGDREIASLTRCVGPLLPIALFDDPEVVRQRLATLRSGGGAPRDVPASFPPALELTVDADGVRRARLRVPDEAPYFADHFPRRRVFPATLLAAALDALAAPAAEAALGAGPARATMLRDYKVRAFSEPGQVLDIVAEPEGVADGVATVRISAAMDGKRTASGRFDYRVGP
jgi:3-hydroxymyristoyl/3-hydroxydecanoyl-(acyl carrier protein) dehydratase